MDPGAEAIAPVRFSGRQKSVSPSGSRVLGQLRETLSRKHPLGSAEQGRVHVLGSIMGCCMSRTRHSGRNGFRDPDQDSSTSYDADGLRFHTPRGSLSIRSMNKGWQEGPQRNTHVPLSPRELLGGDDAPADPDNIVVAKGGAETKGGYRWNTPELLEEMRARRAVVWRWLRSIGGTLFKDGVNLTKISMPVELFEGRSFLQRLTESWAHMGLLSAAADATDPVERMRCVVAWVLAGLSCQVSAFKPFNPILGETFAGTYPDGTSLFIEQASHHPPVSAWQMEDARQRYRFDGIANYEASTKPNSVRARQLGENRLHFASDGAVVTWELPELFVLNVMFGEMHLKYRGVLHFQDPMNGVTCEVEVDPPRPRRARGEEAALWRPDMVVGSIKLNGRPVDAISGSWLDHLTWLKASGGGPRKYFQFKETTRSYPIPTRYPLPSDSRFREDLQCFIKGDLKGAAAWKTKLEEVQRKDRKWRGTKG